MILRKIKIRKREMQMQMTKRKKRYQKKNQMMTNRPNYRHSLMTLILKLRRLSKVTLIIQKISNMI